MREFFGEFFPPSFILHPSPLTPASFRSTRYAAPGANVGAFGIQDKGGLDGRIAAAGAGGLEDTQNRRQAKDFLSAGSADDPILFNQKVIVVIG